MRRPRPRRLRSRHTPPRRRRRTRARSTTTTTTTRARRHAAGRTRITRYPRRARELHAAGSGRLIGAGAFPRAAQRHAAHGARHGRRALIVAVAAVAGVIAVAAAVAAGGVVAVAAGLGVAAGVGAVDADLQARNVSARVCLEKKRVDGADCAVRVAQLRLVEARAALHDVAVVAFEFEALAGGRAFEA